MRQALSYAFDGTCDAHLAHTSGTDALSRYSDHAAVMRFTVTAGTIQTDRLDARALTLWVNGDDPETGEHRGRRLESPDADLILDGTINAPKSFSLAVLIHPELGAEFEALQDRLRNRIILTWQRELNARRGAGGRIRESLHRVEVVELQHRRSRALDPHIHRHLWLNVKVQGVDGQWSNVDSRVAMRLHTVINAEGELACRTDPEWTAALARHGYTLDTTGEIVQLAHLVRPLSRRANQIEANRARHLAQWRHDHPWQESSPEVLQQIDRWAWAAGRPDKPDTIDETSWEQVLRDEIHALDAHALEVLTATSPDTSRLADLDRDLLAARAIVDADSRSTSCGGRFSPMDVRAGAMRAVAASGVCADRNLLQKVIGDVVARAWRDTVDVLDDDTEVPAHIKHLMSAQTATLKLDLAERFDALSEPGVSIPEDAVATLVRFTFGPHVLLDRGQTDAAAAIGGTHRLVTITGPAGSGKTTMLRLAQAALVRQGRRMVVVAPTKKAASVAAREVATAASSLHALLMDHGWRYRTDAAGSDVWWRLCPGDIDEATGLAYAGPRRYPLTPADRIVVDEAGMVDLHAANALAIVAGETGVGIAIVGDDLQARPVGHAGAMACMARRSGAVVELTAVHRFRDPGYAALTLRMRSPRSQDEAAAVAEEFARSGLIHRVDHEAAACEAMVDTYFRYQRDGQRVALVTATNADAAAISAAVQQQRIELGQLSEDRVAVGMRGDRLLIGDVVQTRRNDAASGVENRAVWVVDGIYGRTVALAAIDDSTDVRVVSLEYAMEHVHLAYASTVPGIQGDTADAAMVGPGVDAAGFYVGMTRGRTRNDALVIARTNDAAVRRVAETLMRGGIETTFDESRAAARAELGRAARIPGGAEQGDGGSDLRPVSHERAVGL
ncbi:AAA family ATPase [Glutamicibacter protophormiae]|uniref:AAA family ATPase n=1 Tax=Glutamicibacter protophormiae TaxID=37930 RepID=UPI003A944A31